MSNIKLEFYDAFRQVLVVTRYDNIAPRLTILADDILSFEPIKE